MKHVIIGAGAAGMTAAKTIRKAQPQDEILIITKDDQSYSRCMIHHYISGERDERSLCFADESLEKDENVKYLWNTTVESVIPGERKVLTSAGEVAYDRLLIAAGASSVIPPIGDLQKAENVFGLRHLSDAKAIRKEAESGKKAVIVGAGLVGLDAAYSLLAKGLDVTVVEMADRILALNLDSHAAKAYQERFEQAGCRFLLGEKVSGTKIDGNNRLTHILLAGDKALDCDFAVVAAGVRPEVSYLTGSGIDVERSVQVDQFLATNWPEIYAAGDVTGLSGIWPNAMKQGETAAKNMCGIETAYTDRYAIKNTVNFFGLVSLSIGELAPQEGDQVEVKEDSKSYKRVILRDHCVVGVLLQGEIGHSGFWQYLIKHQINISAIPKSIWKLSYGDFAEMADNGEYRWA